MHPNNNLIEKPSSDPHLKERIDILSLPADQALDRILKSQAPKDLVESFSESDLYYLIQGIGFEDALPILSMASNKQWEYLFDMEIWDGDRIKLNSMTQWIDRIYRADAGRCAQWLLQEKPEFIEYFVFKSMEVRIRDHDQDPSDFGDEFITFDNVFYIKLKQLPDEAEPPPPDLTDDKSGDPKEFVTKLVEKFAALDHVAFQKILFEAAHVIPSESEEEEYRLRNVRLAEKGFVPLEEAIGIYQPLSVKRLRSRDSQKDHITKSVTEPFERPYMPFRMLQSSGAFTRALKKIDAEPLLMTLQVEFASLCNQLMVADHKKFSHIDQLQQIAQKAIGYINVGLDRLFIDQYPTGTAMASKAVSGISQYMLADLFRVGYHQVMEIKWRAEKWLESCWFARQGYPLTFWGESWLGVLGGLLLKRPMFFDNFRSGSLYRDFGSSMDINATKETLEDIIALDELLSCLQLPTATLKSAGLITYSNLILTGWARHELGLAEDLAPITLSEFKPFYEALWQTKTKPKKIRQSMKDAFLAWLTSNCRLDKEQLSERYGHVLSRLFAGIEEEYGDVKPEDIDPRYMSMFLLER